MSVVDEEKEIDAKFSLPIGLHQEISTQMARKNPIEAQYALLWECLLEWKGSPRNEVYPSIFESLFLPTLDHLQDKFMEGQPGPELRFSTECPECDADINVEMSSSDFLFPLPKMGRT